MAHRTKIIVSGIAVLVIVGLLAWGVSSGGDTVDSGAGNPVSQATDYDAALAGAPKPLAELYSQGDAILDGGPDAFEGQLAKLRGYPVVVNKWASWCGPCRYEFPFFQSQAAKRGDRIAFVGIDSIDDADAAQTFLDEFPLPYPSYSDPDKQLNKTIEGFYTPATAYYDKAGKLVYTHQGTYRDEAALESDIDKYAH